MNSCVLISGCSEGGKSTILAELAAHGFSIVEEPGRRIVKQELQCNGNALSWTDKGAFARRAIQMAKKITLPLRRNQAGRSLTDASLMPLLRCIMQPASQSRKN